MTKKLAMIAGWILVILGVLGLINNPIVGSGPESIFMSGLSLSLVHLISGAILLWSVYGSSEKGSLLLKVLGAIYVVVAILGFIKEGSLLGLFTTNTPDDWLHLVLGVLLLWAGFARSQASAPAPGPMSGSAM